MKGRGFLRTLGGAASSDAPCAWSFHEGTLTLAPDGARPLALSLRECSGVEGDEFAVSLRASGAAWELSKLGADGPTLLDVLRRAWPPLRADALRLTGRGEYRAYPCHVAWGDGAPRPGLALFFDDLLLAAPWGEDLAPLFLSLAEEVLADDETWGITVRSHLGRSLALSRLGAKRDEAAAGLAAARDGLARRALGLLGTSLPSLEASDKAVLASLWLPGRLCAASELSAAAPSCLQALEGWIGLLPRGKEAALLREGAGLEDTCFALLPGESREAAPAEAGDEGGDAGPAAPGQGPVLWMAVRREGCWLLEALSEGDRATYAFEGGPELHGLLSMLLCAPQFSREALYLPIEKLAGERAPLAAAARDLPFLKDLRARLKTRAIHRGLDAWRKSLGI